MNELFHVTPVWNLESILSRGLVPAIGPRSEKLGESQFGIYFFRSRAEVEDAIENWLGDEFEPNDGVGLVVVDPSKIQGFLEDKSSQFEVVAWGVIPPEAILRVEYLEEPRNSETYQVGMVVDGEGARRLVARENAGANYVDDIQYSFDAQPEAWREIARLGPQKSLLKCLNEELLVPLAVSRTLRDMIHRYGESWNGMESVGTESANVNLSAGGFVVSLPGAWDEVIEYETTKRQNTGLLREPSLSLHPKG